MYKEKAAFKDEQTRVEELMGLLDGEASDEIRNWESNKYPTVKELLKALQGIFGDPLEYLNATNEWANIKWAGDLASTFRSIDKLALVLGHGIRECQVKAEENVLEHVKIHVRVWSIQALGEPTELTYQMYKDEAIQITALHQAGNKRTRDWKNKKEGGSGKQAKSQPTSEEFMDLQKEMADLKANRASNGPPSGPAAMRISEQDKKEMMEKRKNKQCPKGKDCYFHSKGECWYGSH